jgi:hypothetical protein
MKAMKTFRQDSRCSSAMRREKLAELKPRMLPLDERSGFLAPVLYQK